MGINPPTGPPYSSGEGGAIQVTYFWGSILGSKSFRVSKIQEIPLQPHPTLLQEGIRRTRRPYSPDPPPFRRGPTVKGSLFRTVGAEGWISSAL